MRAREFVKEDAAVTASGDIGVVSMPLSFQTRQGGSLLTGKYSNAPANAAEPKKHRKTHAVRKFENSISN